MIRSWKNQGTIDIARGDNTKAARKLLPAELHYAAQKALKVLHAAPNLLTLKGRRSLRLHSLGGSRKGQFSISINDQYRVCFHWNDGNAEDVEIVDYH